MCFRLFCVRQTAVLPGAPTPPAFGGERRSWCAVYRGQGEARGGGVTVSSITNSPLGHGGDLYFRSPCILTKCERAPVPILILRGEHVLVRVRLDDARRALVLDEPERERARRVHARAHAGHDARRHLLSTMDTLKPKHARLLTRVDMLTIDLHRNIRHHHPESDPPFHRHSHPQSRSIRRWLAQTHAPPERLGGSTGPTPVGTLIVARDPFGAGGGLPRSALAHERLAFRL